MDLIMYLILLLLSLEQVLNAPHGRRRKLTPSFLPTPTDITAYRGEIVVLKCHIKDVGPKKVVWRKESSDVPLTIGETIFSPESNMAIEVDKISEDETRYDLIIKDVDLKHSGNYLCQVTASKTYAHYVTLTVLEEPYKHKNSISLTGTEYVSQGNPIGLICNVTGILQAPTDVDWFFNGERIITTLPHWKDRTQILRRTKGTMYISDLIVERSTLKDNGRYVCRSSGISIDVDSITVNVLSAGVKQKDRRGFHISDNVDNQEGGPPSGYSHSAAITNYHSGLTYILTLTICFIVALTSNSCSNIPINVFATLKSTLLNCDNYAHR